MKNNLFLLLLVFKSIIISSCTKNFITSESSLNISFNEYSSKELLKNQTLTSINNENKNISEKNNIQSNNNSSIIDNYPRLTHKNNLDNISKATTTIFLSGLFDKSFFITAFMAMKYSKCIVMFSATLSLSLIGIISVYLGLTINQYISVFWIDSLAVILFLIFGSHMIYEGLSMNEEYQTELDIPEKINENEINKNEDEETGLINDKQKSDTLKKDIDEQIKTNDRNTSKTGNYFCNKSIQAFYKIFSLIFFSEIGDRSQISTIYLTTNFDKLSVIIAVIVSSASLTLLAILGGRLIGNKMSEKKLTIFAGGVFIVFGVIALILLIQGEGNLETDSIKVSEKSKEFYNQYLIHNTTKILNSKIR